MVKIFGKNYSKEELRKRLGTIHQLTFALPFEFIDGRQRNVRAVEVKTGSGFSFLVIIDRGLDIGMAEFKGIPLSYLSPTLFVHPSYYEPSRNGWFIGSFLGLLTTCGLTQVGRPCIDQGEELGLHGRYSYIPASNVTVTHSWEGDDCYIVVKGEIRESIFFGPNLAVYREIKARLGDKKIIISDEVVNEGYEKQPFMILYHFNFGFPIVSENSKILLTSHLYTPRDEESKKDAKNFDVLHEPKKGFIEKVYFHDLLTDNAGYAYAGIINYELKLGVYIKFKKSELHRFTQWKMLGEQNYVVGLEPSNCFVLGRVKEREWGTLQYIAPNEKRNFTLEFGVLEGDKEVKEFENKIRNITKGKKPEYVEKIEDFIKLTTKLK